ncbi:hypothetical protein BD560DRAFT_397425 [Blakeslea trispora]|nr:hypothetical protein BD560DRAFT_397425 [Blakeslea trispora]
MELPQIGKHCQLEGCHTLDFLPIRCSLCQHTFCGDHRLPSSHHCSQWQQQTTVCDVCDQLVKVPDNLQLEEALKQHKASNCGVNSVPKINRQCGVKGCFDIDPRVGPVHCSGCDKDYCLNHRHPSSHQCSSISLEETRTREKKLATQALLAKTFATEPKQKITKRVPAQGKNGGMVELMKIKSKAKGVTSVPATSRIYLYIQCPQEANMDSLTMYFDKKHSVGRVLDFIADTCQVNNQNHVLAASDPQRLELYQCPDMRLLDKSLPLEKALKNLDTILLERQGCLSIDE